MGTLSSKAQLLFNQDRTGPCPALTERLLHKTKPPVCSSQTGGHRRQVLWGHSA